LLATAVLAAVAAIIAPDALRHASAPTSESARIEKPRVSGAFP
jgi:hypothetical protein